MVQTIAVALIIIAAAALLIRRITKGCGCSCGCSCAITGSKKSGKNSCGSDTNSEK